VFDAAEAPPALSEVYTMNPDGSGEVQLTTLGNNAKPDWQPTSPPMCPGGSTPVSIRDHMFSPQTLNVTPGTTVGVTDGGPATRTAPATPTSAPAPSASAARQVACPACHRLQALACPGGDQESPLLGRPSADGSLPPPRPGHRPEAAPGLGPPARISGRPRRRA